MGWGWGGGRLPCGRLLAAMPAGAPFNRGGLPFTPSHRRLQACCAPAHLPQNSRKERRPTFRIILQTCVASISCCRLPISVSKTA